MANQKIINDQLHQFKMKIIKRMQDEILEGELVKRQVEEELLRERQRDQERRQKLVAQAKDFKTTNQKQIEAAAEERRKEKEEEKRIEEYAQKRD